MLRASFLKLCISDYLFSHFKIFVLQLRQTTAKLIIPKSKCQCLQTYSSQFTWPHLMAKCVCIILLHLMKGQWLMMLFQHKQYWLHILGIYDCLKETLHGSVQSGHFFCWLLLFQTDLSEFAVCSKTSQDSILVAEVQPAVGVYKGLGGNQKCNNCFIKYKGSLYTEFN